MMSLTLALAMLGAAPESGGAEAYLVDPDAGNNNFASVFDAPFGERINAVSSALDCAMAYDDSKQTASGVCTVGVTTIRVDNDDTKSEHFQQWATQKKSEPKDCRIQARFDNVKLSAPLASKKGVTFTAEVPFTVCGRRRVDGGKERVEGSAMLFPPGEYGTAKTLRIRARIAKFDREKYEIGPRFTDGWLARVQSLANVVAVEGTVDISLFAKVRSGK